MSNDIASMHSGLLYGHPSHWQPSKLPWCITALSVAACVLVLATRDSLPSGNFGVPAPTEDFASVGGAQLRRSSGEQHGPSYIGCFVDDSRRDLQDGPRQYGYTSTTCAVACDAYIYFALQNRGWCVCGYAYDTESQYRQVADSQCGSPCAHESSGYCGAGWRNAVFQTHAGLPAASGPAHSYHFMKLDGFGNAPPTSTAAYAGSSLAEGVTLDSGIQQWVVPMTGIYKISAAGASTFHNEVMPYTGRGAAVSGMFSLHAGTHLNILVGQMGCVHANNDGAAGGGGASWIWIADAEEPLLVAGGAGGSREQVGSNPLRFISGTVDGHSRAHCLDGRLLANPFDEHCTNNRNGGYSRAYHCDGGGGGGWSRDGAHGGENAEGGHAIQSGTPGKGGNSGGCGGYDPGGFGGGGAGGFDAGGGGGGYIGGDGGQYNGVYLPGTGGSSHVGKRALSFTVGDFWNDADGFVKFEQQ